MKTLTQQELIDIRKEARLLMLRSRKASISMTTDYDEELGGYVIEEMYISTCGIALHTNEEVDDYVKQIRECQDFLNLYANYVKYRKD